MNNHYIPQFLLKHFCENGTIQYCDIESRKVEARNTRSVFSEKGYYPDELEHDLCNKIESQFSKLLNDKLAISRYKVTINSDEMFILKKYMIITALRYNSRELEDDPIISQMPLAEKTKLIGDFYSRINRVLNCKNQNEMLQLIDIEKMNNIGLFTYVKNIMHSYTIIVKTNNCKQDFLITDRGCTRYSGPLSVKKAFMLLDVAKETNDPFLWQLASMVTIHDYSVFPITRNMAIINMSVFFKLFTKASPYRAMLSNLSSAINSVLGFGDSSIIEDPKVKALTTGGKEYTMEIKQLSSTDVFFLNSLLFSLCNKNFAFANKSRIEQSLEYIQKEKSIDLSFIVDKDSNNN